MNGRFISKEATVTVNTLEDGFLSSVGDAAVVNIQDLYETSIFINRVTDTAGVPSTLDLDPITTNADTVLETVPADLDGDDVTLAFVADGTGTGTLDESAFPDIVFHFEDGVTTVANFEAAVAASTHLAVNTAGTGANILAETVDEFVATNFSGGDNEAAISLLVEGTVDGTNYATLGSVDEDDFGDGNNVAHEFSLSDSNGMSRSYREIRVSVVTLDEPSVFSVVAAGSLRRGL